MPPAAPPFPAPPQPRASAASPLLLSPTSPSWGAAWRKGGFRAASVPAPCPPTWPGLPGAGSLGSTGSAADGLPGGERRGTEDEPRSGAVSPAQIAFLLRSDFSCRAGSLWCSFIHYSVAEMALWGQEGDRVSLSRRPWGCGHEHCAQPWCLLQARAGVWHARCPSHALASRHVPRSRLRGHGRAGTATSASDGAGRLQQDQLCPPGLCCVTLVYLAPAGSRGVSRQHQALEVPRAAGTAWHHERNRASVPTLLWQGTRSHRWPHSLCMAPAPLEGWDPTGCRHRGRSAGASPTPTGNALCRSRGMGLPNSMAFVLRR